MLREKRQIDRQRERERERDVRSRKDKCRDVVTEAVNVVMSFNSTPGLVLLEVLEGQYETIILNLP